MSASHRPVLLLSPVVGVSSQLLNVVVSRDLGAGRHDNVSHSVHTTMTLALISGIASDPPHMSMLCFLFTIPAPLFKKPSYFIIKEWGNPEEK